MTLEERQQQAIEAIEAIVQETAKDITSDRQKERKKLSAILGAIGLRDEEYTILTGRDEPEILREIKLTFLEFCTEHMEYRAWNTAWNAFRASEEYTFEYQPEWPEF